MVNYNKLIDKYYKKEGENATAHFKYKDGERTSNEFRNARRLEEKEKHRYLLFQELLNEIPFHLNKSQVKQIGYWLKKFNKDFKQFHRRSSEKTIILAFIMIQRKNVKPKIQVDKFGICKKYNLTPPVFELIQNRLIFELMRTTELTYNQSKYYDHELLIKEGR